MVTNNNPLLLLPIIFPLIGIALTILLAQDHFDRARRWVALLVLAVGWLGSISVLLMNLSEGIQLYRIGGYPSPYGIVLVADKLGALFAVMGTTVLLAGAIYSLGCKDKSMTYPVYVPLFLGMCMGLSGCFYTGDIFTLFVFLELMVLSSVGLVATSDNPLGLEAAIKYLFISAMGSLFLLLGIAAVYTTHGSLTLADIAQQLGTGQRPLLAEAAAVMLMSAFLVKSAVFPFHFWQPDFHTTAPTPISALLSSVVVKVGVYGIIRLTTLLYIEEAAIIQEALILLGMIGIYFGSLSAAQTYDAKRMLAYSTFGQIGFVLVAVGWGSQLALVAAIVYAVNHAFIKSALLMLTGLIASRLKTKTATLSKLHGVGRGMPLASGLYMIGGLALAGIPPLNGFISKLALIRGGIDVESWVILGFAVGGGIITLMYMVRTWQLIFQEAPEAREEEYRKPHGEGDSPLAPLLLIGLCIVLGFYASPLVSLAEEAVLQLQDSEIYIRSVMGGS